MVNCKYCSHEVDNLKTHISQMHNAMEDYALEDDMDNAISKIPLKDRTVDKKEFLKSIGKSDEAKADYNLEPARKQMRNDKKTLDGLLDYGLDTEDGKKLGLGYQEGEENELEDARDKMKNQKFTSDWTDKETKIQDPSGQMGHPWQKGGEATDIDSRYNFDKDGKDSYGKTREDHIEWEKKHPYWEEEGSDREADEADNFPQKKYPSEKEWDEDLKHLKQLGGKEGLVVHDEDSTYMGRVRGTGDGADGVFYNLDNAKKMADSMNGYVTTEEDADNPWPEEVAVYISRGYKPYQFESFASEYNIWGDSARQFWRDGMDTINFNRDEMESFVQESGARITNEDMDTPWSELSDSSKNEVTKFYNWLCMDSSDEADNRINISYNGKNYKNFDDIGKDEKSEEADNFPQTKGQSEKEWKEDLQHLKNNISYKWDNESFNNKVESFESLGYTQGDALKLADLTWYDLSNEVQDALEESITSASDDDDGARTDLRNSSDNDEVDYNKIGESTTLRTKYECEQCWKGFKSNEALDTHYNDQHAISPEVLDGYESHPLKKKISKINEDYDDTENRLKDHGQHDHKYDMNGNCKTCGWSQDIIEDGDDAYWRNNPDEYKSKNQESISNESIWKVNTITHGSIRITLGREADEIDAINALARQHHDDGFISIDDIINAVKVGEVYNKDGFYECPYCGEERREFKDGYCSNCSKTEINKEMEADEAKYDPEAKCSCDKYYPHIGRHLMKDHEYPVTDYHNSINQVEETYTQEEIDAHKKTGGTYPASWLEKANKMEKIAHEDVWDDLMEKKSKKLKKDFGDFAVEKAHEHISDEWWWNNFNWHSGYDQDFMPCNHCGEDMLTTTYNKHHTFSDDKLREESISHLRRHGINESYGTEKYPRTMDYMTLEGKNDWGMDATLCMICDTKFNTYPEFLEHYQNHSDKETGESYDGIKIFGATESVDFNEQEHPRADDGKFTSGGGSGKHADKSEKDLVKGIKGGSANWKDWYRNETNEELYQEIEKRNKAVPFPKRPEGVGATIFRDDTDAVSKMENKIKYLEDIQDYWKKIIKFPARDYKNRGQLGDAKWYELTGAGANLRDARKKLEGIKMQQARGTNLVRKATYPDGKKRFYYEEQPKTTEGLAEDILDDILAKYDDDVPEDVEAVYKELRSKGVSKEEAIRALDGVMADTSSLGEAGHDDYKCPECGFVTTSEDELNDHELAHISEETISTEAYFPAPYDKHFQWVASMDQDDYHCKHCGQMMMYEGDAIHTFPQNIMIEVAKQHLKQHGINEVVSTEAEGKFINLFKISDNEWTLGIKNYMYTLDDRVAKNLISTYNLNDNANFGTYRGRVPNHAVSQWTGEALANEDFFDNGIEAMKYNIVFEDNGEDWGFQTNSRSEAQRAVDEWNKDNDNTYTGYSGTGRKIKIKEY